MRERAETPEPEAAAAADRPQPQPQYRSGLPAIARPQPRRIRWPLWIAAAVVLVVALGAAFVFRGEIGGKSQLPWRSSSQG
ncbi:MAG: hypothetical protein U1E60_01830 [Reyranellaceae bacterium]